MSPFQGSLFIYPYHPGRRGPAGRLPWAFMSRPFRPRQMPDASDSGFARHQPTTSQLRSGKSPEGARHSSPGRRTPEACAALGKGKCSLSPERAIHKPGLPPAV